MLWLRDLLLGDEYSVDGNCVRDREDDPVGVVTVVELDRSRERVDRRSYAPGEDRKESSDPDDRVNPLVLDRVSRDRVDPKVLVRLEVSRYV